LRGKAEVPAMLPEFDRREVKKRLRDQWISNIEAGKRLNRLDERDFSG
jgi:ribosomal protein L20